MRRLLLLAACLLAAACSTSPTGVDPHCAQLEQDYASGHNPFTSTANALDAAQLMGCNAGATQGH